jgi:SAM-dependent methyltransferase
MLARRELPEDYRQWNNTWGAPDGQHRKAIENLGRLPASVREVVLRSPRVQRERGPFAFQPNTSTRSYEYPWTYFQLANLGPSRILEIGGALSGLQFVLAKDGHDVHNVDPFFDYGVGEYDVDPIAEHASLNRVFGTNVTLHRATLPEADIAGTFSAAICVSTIEHLSSGDIEATLRAVKRLLAPGGLVVLTVDLFLNLTPFCSRTTNVWGSNASVAWIDELLGYTMVAGDRSELYGYPEFSTDQILSRLDEFAIGIYYPQMAQLVSFKAPRV